MHLIFSFLVQQPLKAFISANAVRLFIVSMVLGYDKDNRKTEMIMHMFLCIISSGDVMYPVLSWQFFRFCAMEFAFIDDAI